jgi:hypothetical protein
MECIICGRTDTDFEKYYKEIIGKIDTTLEILYDKRKEFRDKVKNDGNVEGKNNNGIELGEINKEIKTLNEKKETLQKGPVFVDADISDETLNNILQNSCNIIIEKYLPKKNKKNNYKICSHCESIIQQIVDERADEKVGEVVDDIKSQIDDIFEDYDYADEDLEKDVSDFLSK